MNELAKKLNDDLIKYNPTIYHMLSNLGKKLFYPKGILSQGNDASKNAYHFNATIGIATEQYVPMHFNHIQEKLRGYSPEDVYTYAPTPGKFELREKWSLKLLRENPSLNNKRFGIPIVTNGITHGLSIAADLFVEEDDCIILPDKYWENYESIFHIRRGGCLKTFELFDKNKQFNVEGLKERLLEQQAVGKAVVILNFPNNPTGYTPSEEEAHGIVQAILEAAESGIKLVIILDDAYFGLFYEDSIKESLFGRLAELHPNILPIKIDGATKESYVWGLRVGFITFASKSFEVLEVLEQKTMGLIRAVLSNSSHLSQTIILQSLISNEYEKEKQQKYEIMCHRAIKVKEIVCKEKYRDLWTLYPFNSGYFICLKFLTVDAEKLRIHLLDEYGIGTLAINSTDLRIAFSCVEEEDLEELFELIYQGIDNFLTKGV